MIAGLEGRKDIRCSSSRLLLATLRPQSWTICCPLFDLHPIHKLFIWLGLVAWKHGWTIFPDLQTHGDGEKQGNRNPSLKNRRSIEQKTANTNSINWTFFWTCMDAVLESPPTLKLQQSLYWIFWLWFDFQHQGFAKIGVSMIMSLLIPDSWPTDLLRDWRDRNGMWHTRKLWLKSIETWNLFNQAWFSSSFAFLPKPIANVKPTPPFGSCPK